MNPNTMMLIQAAGLITPIADQKCEETKDNKRLVKAGKRTEISIALAFAVESLFWRAEA